MISRREDQKKDGRHRRRRKARLVLHLKGHSAEQDYISAIEDDVFVITDIRRARRLPFAYTVPLGARINPSQANSNCWGWRPLLAQPSSPF